VQFAVRKQQKNVEGVAAVSVVSDFDAAQFERVVYRPTKSCHSVSQRPAAPICTMQS